MSIIRAGFFITLVLTAVLLGGCAEVNALRERTAQQQNEIERLRGENAEFRKAYYTIKETLDSEDEKNLQRITELNRELEECQNLRSQREKDLGDEVRTLTLEMQALRQELVDQKTLAETEIGTLRRQIDTLTAEKNAALTKLDRLDEALLNERQVIATLNQQVAALGVDVQTLTDQKNNLANELAQRDASIVKLNEEKKALVEAETGLKEELGAAEISLAEEKQKTATQAQELETATKQLAEATQKLTATTQQLTATQGELETARAKLNDAASTGALAQLKQQVDALTADLAAARAETAAQAEQLAAQHAQALEAERAAARQAAVDARDPRKDPELVQATTELIQTYATTEGTGGVQVVLDDRGLHIVLPSDRLFMSGTLNLGEAAAGLLQPAAEKLKALGNRPLRVEGHTDNQPIGELPFADNWGLAYARADRVRAWLMEQGGLDGARIASVSRGPVDPLGDNATPEGRATNRRVELVVGLKE